MPPSDTFFTAAPGWGWLIVLYFFFGGIAGGSFFFAAALDLFGGPAHARLARIGYLVALPALLPCPPLLVADLNRPERFWHMMLMNHRLVPIFKPWSPMSFGSWALLLFGLFATLAFAGALGERIPRLAFLRRGAIGKAIAAIGGVLGFFVAGYTGVLLSVTNRPIWADSPVLGALFLLSAVTTSAALLVWIGRRRAAPASIAWLSRVEGWAAIAEIAALVATLITLGPVARVFLGPWGLLLAVGTVLLGLVAPFALHRRPDLLGARTAPVGSLLALAGGFTLRAVMIFSSEAL
jgi:protein NrfD